MCVKDGIVDYFECKGFECFVVDKIVLDICIYVYLNCDDMVILFDLSGEVLYMCGYCLDIGKVLLCEILVVVIVLCFGW